MKFQTLVAGEAGPAGTIVDSIPLADCFFDAAGYVRAKAVDDEAKTAVDTYLSERFPDGIQKAREAHRLASALWNIGDMFPPAVANRRPDEPQAESSTEG